MKTFNLFTFLLMAGVLSGGTGCGKSHPVPPSERNALVLRFFNSMQSGDSATASAQGEKLRLMDPGNDYIVKLVTIQQCNGYLQKAQQEVNAGRINEALKVLDEGCKAYPLNRELARQRNRVKLLRNAAMLIREMKEAKSSASMSAAHTAASTALAGNMTPKLRKYLDEYKLRIAEVAADETKVVAEPPAPVRL